MNRGNIIPRLTEEQFKEIKKDAQRFRRIKAIETINNKDKIGMIILNRWQEVLGNGF